MSPFTLITKKNAGTLIPAEDNLIYSMESKKREKKQSRINYKIIAIKSKNNTAFKKGKEFKITNKEANFPTRDKIQGWKNTCQVNKNQKKGKIVP